MYLMLLDFRLAHRCDSKCREVLGQEMYRMDAGLSEGEDKAISMQSRLPLISTVIAICTHLPDRSYEGPYGSEILLPVDIQYGVVVAPLED
jgi:hypothetical protein